MRGARTTSSQVGPGDPILPIARWLSFSSLLPSVITAGRLLVTGEIQRDRPITIQLPLQPVLPPPCAPLAPARVAYRHRNRCADPFFLLGGHPRRRERPHRGQGTTVHLSLFYCLSHVLILS